MTATQLTDRAVIRLSPQDQGEDVREFLQGLVTQDMRKVAQGAPQWAALLTPQGKVLFDFMLWADGRNDILIDCEKHAADDLIRRLSLYRLRRKITIAHNEALNVHWSPNPSGQDHAVTDPRLADLGYRWLSEQTSDAADAQWLAHRLSFGVAEGQAELGNDKTLWLECNAEELNGVSYEKGCFIGQENTARMHYRSKVNRRIVVLSPDQIEAKRLRTAYPDIGLAVGHMRVEDLHGLKLPTWLENATGQQH